MKAGGIPATTLINVSEVYSGMREGEEEKTDLLLKSLKILSLTFNSAKEAGIWRARYKMEGRTFSLADLIIAAVAKEHNAIVLTENVGDFPREVKVMKVP